MRTSSANPTTTRRGEIAYLDKDGKEQDTSIQDAILAAGDDSGHLAKTIARQRQAGMSEAQIKMLYGKA